MFYITFSVQKVEGCRPIARVSVDGGPAFCVYNGPVYKFKSGRARVLHIYQGTSKKALNGRVAYQCFLSYIDTSIIASRMPKSQDGSRKTQGKKENEGGFSKSPPRAPRKRLYP